MAYPSKSQIQEYVSGLASGDFESFYKHVSPDVDWELRGTSQISGRFASLEAFQEKAVGVIRKALSGPLKMKVVNVVGGGDQEWAMVEMEADGVAHNGMKYPQQYAWVLRFNDKGVIVQARAYLDTLLLDKVLDANK